MSYKKLAEDVKPGDNSAVLGERKNVNLPGIVVDLPTLTEKDKEDILQWGVPNKINIIALSFVRKGSDLDEVRRLLGVHAKSIMLMSKVENQGVANVDEIMEKTDAFMKANALGKPIVTATQMLESMTKAPRPTRAEATEVANAVLDGTDCVMLSGEIAAGAHPEAAVKTMSMICKEAEEYLDYEAVHKKIKEAVPLPLSTIESEALNAKAIVVVTKGGYTAELVAKYRPSVPILTVVDQECPEAAASVASRGLVYRGIIPVVATGASTEEKVRFAVEVAKKKEICKAGDLVVTFRMINGSSVVETLGVLVNILVHGVLGFSRKDTTGEIVIGSVLAVKHIIHIFPEIGKGPKLNASIHQGALTEGLLTFFTVLISVGLSRNIPGSFFMKTWISSIAKLTLHVHVLGVGITGGCMNPAAVMGWAYARGEHITKEHLLVYWLGSVMATLLVVWFFNVVFKPLTEEQEKPKAKSE
ncbi:hypothetical protein Bca101_093959 [Brassica carinata]